MTLVSVFPEYVVLFSGFRWTGTYRNGVSKYRPIATYRFVVLCTGYGTYPPLLLLSLNLKTSLWPGPDLGLLASSSLLPGPCPEVALTAQHKVHPTPRALVSQSRSPPLHFPAPLPSPVHRSADDPGPNSLGRGTRTALLLRQNTSPKYTLPSFPVQRYLCCPPPSPTRDGRPLHLHPVSLSPPSTTARPPLPLTTYN